MPARRAVCPGIVPPLARAWGQVTSRVMEVVPGMPDVGETLLARMGIEVTEATVERVVGTMPVAGNTQPFGLLHGGASCVLAETLGSMGSAIHAHPDRYP